MNTPRSRQGFLGLGTALLSLLLATSGLSQERFRRVPPPPDPTPELRLPNVETYILTNGLTVSTVYREDQPFINIQLIIRAGEADSPPNLPGVATFTANMLVRGTLELTEADITERIESMGGHLSITTDPEATVFAFEFLEPYLDQAVELLSQIILRPVFNDVEVGAVRYKIYYDLFEKEKDAAFVAKRQLLRELFRNHPYASGYSKKEAIKNIRQADLIQFFQTHYFPNRAHIILSGNLTLGMAVRMVSHNFNTWVRGPEAAPPPPPPSANNALRVLFIDVPQASDGMVYLGNIVPAMTSPDYFPLLVFHQVLGGSVNSRLILNLRESKGYAYYVFSQIETFPGFNVFLIRARLAPPFVYPAVQEIMNELRLNATHPLPEAEVEQAKTFLIGDFPLSLERLENLSAKIAELKMFNLSDDFWSRYEENILLVNGDRVFKLAQSLVLLTPVIVITGDKRLLADQLKYFDRVDIFDAQGTFQYSLSKETEK
jgi:zinc protease